MCAYHIVSLEIPAWRAAGGHTSQGHITIMILLHNMVAGVPSELYLGCLSLCSIQMTSLWELDILD